MVHTSLYRKYRPETFDDVIGQNHIERTLRNAVAEGTVAHAYLFTGPRGTGKTTTARLLAKALLCAKGPTGEPDATCQDCVDIAEGRHPDVHELDAASRTGVDSVREEIIGRVQYAPTRGTYKVYIIDEVHMLSTQAFNALLKTLEEPPDHVVFVLATTHPHKVPETIQSRCQRFDFHRISVEDLVFRLRFISNAEGFEVSDAALGLMARHASGGMRDAITTLEQLAAFTGGKIGLEDVEGLIGEVDSSLLFEVSDLVARRDIAACFRWVAHFVESGTDLAEFVRALTAHIRDVYVVAAVGDATGIVDRTAEEMAKLQQQAITFGGPDRLARVIDLLGELAAEMRWSSDPRMSLEVALTRMARPQGEMTLEALAERVEALELGVPAVPGRTAAQCAPESRPVAPAASSVPAAAEVPSDERPAVVPGEGANADDDSDQSQQDDAAVPEPRLNSELLERGAVKRGWQTVVAEIRKRKPARVQTYLDVEVDVDTDGKTLVIEFPANQTFSMDLADQPEMREMLKKALHMAFGYVPPFRFKIGRGAIVPPSDAVSTQAPRTSPTRIDDGAAHGDAPTDDYVPVEAYGDFDPEVEPASAPAGPADRQHQAEEQEHSGDLADLLVNGLGARIVTELPAQNGEDE